MIRRQMVERAPRYTNGFRWRGDDVSRIEGFSDAVFGFALTLLVVSLQIPKTVMELEGLMRGFIAFGLCFWLLARIWTNHYTFFRRYALHDATTRALNNTLLFLVLFYVYPLKFLFTFVVEIFSDKPAAFAMVAGITTGSLPGALWHSRMQSLFTIYGVGFAAVFLVQALMYVHAYRLRSTLQLNPLEEFHTRRTALLLLVPVVFGAASILLARTLPLSHIGDAGWCYFGIWPVNALIGFAGGKQRRALEAKHAPGRDESETEL